MSCCIPNQIQTVLESEWKRGKRTIQRKITHKPFLSHIYGGNLASAPCDDKYTSATAGQATSALCDSTEQGAPFNTNNTDLELPAQFCYTKGSDGEGLPASQRMQILMKHLSEEK